MSIETLIIYFLAFVLSGVALIIFLAMILTVTYKNKSKRNQRKQQYHQ